MKTIKTSWNLGLLYKSERDPQIEKDMQKIEKFFEAGLKGIEEDIAKLEELTVKMKPKKRKLSL